MSVRMMPIPLPIEKRRLWARRKAQLAVIGATGFTVGVTAHPEVAGATSRTIGWLLLGGLIAAVACAARQAGATDRAGWGVVPSALRDGPLFTLGVFTYLSWGVTLGEVPTSIGAVMLCAAVVAISASAYLSGARTVGQELAP